MNTLKGKIESINTSADLSIVSVSVSNIIFKSIVIETPDTVNYLKRGHRVDLHFKETEVVISKGDSDSISMQNIIPGKVTEIENGHLLSRIAIQSDIGKIISIITSDSVKRLDLTVGQQVDALIKTNEIMLSDD